MLDANIKTQLKSHFEKISQPIEIVASLDDGPKSREVGQLLEELASLSDRITVIQQPDASDRKPSFSLNRPGESLGIRFSGVPMGHEFTSLVLALLQVGGHAHKLSADTVAQIQALPCDYTFQTYVSLTCQNCPE
ncbi:MAG: alkyl hydroperoxide reductase subunit F, partial [Comamonadaceae bacterium]